MAQIQNKARQLLANFIVSKHFAFSPNNELIVGSQVFDVMPSVKAQFLNDQLREMPKLKYENC